MTGRIKIEIGQRVGSQTVLERFAVKEGSNLQSVSYIKLRCDCGTVTAKRSGKLGVMCKNCAEIFNWYQAKEANKAAVGHRQGSLTIIAREGTVSTHARYTVRCDCGAVFNTRAKNFKSRTACYDCNMKRVYPHMDLEKGTKNHPLFVTWMGLTQRCYNENQKDFRLYGALGVTVCDRWRGERKQGQIRCSMDGFHNFLADMGPRPSPTHTVDRIDSHGNYEPSNCRWATKMEQTHNTRANHKNC